MLALADYWFQWLVTHASCSFGCGDNVKLTTCFSAHFSNAARPGVYGSSFMSLLYFGASARLPLLERLDGLSKTMPISLLYGGRGDWMGPDGGRQLAKRLNSLRSSSPDKYNGSGPQIDVHLVPDAGHQLFLENPTESAATLLRVIEMTY
jgi:pimeloyl-ACP methyl ester carboxylesterase